MQTNKTNPKDYLKTKETEAKSLNNKRGGWDKFMGNNKKNGMSLLQEEAEKDNKNWDKNKAKKKNDESFQLFLLFLVFLVLLIYLF